MAELNEEMKKVLKDCGLDKTAVWKHGQSGKFIIYHHAVEKAAAHLGITFDPPQIIEANGENGIAAICVTGHHDQKQEWSIGEASPKNNKNAYPWAMAEKRAKDRVVLKLIGLHGLAYSEEEADEFVPPQQEPQEEPKNTLQEQSAVDRLVTAINASQNEGQLDRLWKNPKVDAAYKSLTDNEKSAVHRADEARRQVFDQDRIIQAA
jgi:hypothetical protein